MMVGEKLKSYEDEANTQVTLESAQDKIKRSIAENFASLIPMAEPGKV